MYALPERSRLKFKGKILARVFLRLSINFLKLSTKELLNINSITNNIFLNSPCFAPVQSKVKYYSL